MGTSPRRPFLFFSPKPLTLTPRPPLFTYATCRPTPSLSLAPNPNRKPKRPSESTSKAT